jgi:hypothetical protein
VAESEYDSLFDTEPDTDVDDAQRDHANVAAVLAGKEKKPAASSTVSLRMRKAAKPAAKAATKAAPTRKRKAPPYSPICHNRFRQGRPAAISIAFSSTRLGTVTGIVPIDFAIVARDMSRIVQTDFVFSYIVERDTIASLVLGSSDSSCFRSG